jgi:Sulfotransferase family
VVRSAKLLVESAGSLFASPVDEPIFVLGNQKSGTTAIAALLSRATGLSMKLDFLGAREPHLSRLLGNELSIDRFVAANKYTLSHAIVKEPNLTFVADRLMEYFGCSKAVFIVRDPRTNIKSLLSRLSIPGNLDALPLGDIWLPNPTWRSILEGHDLDSRHDHYIDIQAHRWSAAVAIFYRRPHRFVLLRYEDFLRNKAESINSLASSLNLEIIEDVAPYVDVQYQRASDKRISVPAFFGEQNLSRINTICAEYMNLLQYQ